MRDQARGLMPPSSRQRTFMRVLVILGGLTFFARCWDQAQPYLRVINKKNGATTGEPAAPAGR